MKRVEVGGLRADLEMSDSLYNWMEPHLLSRSPSTPLARTLLEGAEELNEHFDFYRQSVTTALGIDPKSCIDDVLEAIKMLQEST